MSAYNMDHAVKSQAMSAAAPTRPSSTRETMLRSQALYVELRRFALGLSQRSRRCLRLIGFAAIFSGLSACEAASITAPISGYNHTKNMYINLFAVNKALGPNYAPGTGGAGDACCVTLPKKWQPGMKVEVEWEYSIGLKGVELMQRRIQVAVPKYSKPGTVNVHFYENSQVKIVVSPCGIRHPDYPMTAEDRLPWVDEDGKSAAEVNARVKEGSDEC